MAYQRILITGGSGRLGSAILSMVDCVAPGRGEMNINSFHECNACIGYHNPEVVIHCAGLVSAMACDQDKRSAWAANVEGTRNVARASRGRRFIYISTDYVFDGGRGNYNEADLPNPVNYYGLTKLIGEQIALDYPNALVVRVPFRRSPWPYDNAWTDQWTSCRWADEAAADVLKAADMKVSGVLHIGGERRSIYDLARSIKSDVKPGTIDTCRIRLPKDTSLDSSKWHSISAR